MSQQMIGQFINAFWQTFMMVFAAGGIAFLVGLPLGVILLITRKGNILPGVTFHRILGMVVNVVRSFPFIILMIAITPLTQVIVGTSIGTVAAIVPLAIAATAFYARIVESVFKEVPAGLIEASLSMGASPLQIIRKVLIRESWPGLLRGMTLTLITLVGYSAMAGAIGGGGLGVLAIRYGYERFETNVMVITVLILIVLVQLIQLFGDWLANLLGKNS